MKNNQTNKRHSRYVLFLLACLAILLPTAVAGCARTHRVTETTIVLPNGTMYSGESKGLYRKLED